MINWVIRVSIYSFLVLLISMVGLIVPCGIAWVYQALTGSLLTSGSEILDGMIACSIAFSVVTQEQLGDIFLFKK